MDINFEVFFNELKQSVIKKTPKRFDSKILEPIFKRNKWKVESWYIHNMNIEKAAKEFIIQFVA